MRIAIVTETYPPEVNGVAMTLGRLAEGMHARGHTIEIVRPRQSKHDACVTDPNAIMHLTVAGLPIPRYDGLRFGLPARGKLIRHWQKHRPDTVHISTEGPLGLTALWAAKKLGIPVSSSFHTNFHEYGKHYGYGFLQSIVMGYLRYVHNAAGCTMVPSQGVLETLEADGFKRVMILARGVDTDQFSPAHRDESLRAEWGAKPQDLVCVYVGRVAEEKNIPLTTEAFRAIAAENPKARMVIVGDGPAREKLEKQNPGFIFAGMRRGEDLGRHYASADLFLFASITETFGNVVSEAMACGNCAVVYDYAAGKQLIHTGTNGIAVPFDNRDAYLKAAAEIARDLGRVRELGAAARETAMGLTWDAVLDDFQHALEDVIAARHTARAAPAGV